MTPVNPSSKGRAPLAELEQQTGSMLGARMPLVLLGCISGLCTVAQAALLATGLALWWQELHPVNELWLYWSGFALLSVVRGGLLFWQARLSFNQALRLRQALRLTLLARLTAAGPVWVRQRPLGDWVSLLLQQVDALHDYYARFRPQQLLAMVLPLIFWLALVCVDLWVGVALLLTAPLIPLFMILIGNHAARASEANQTALNHLAGHFLNRLESLATLRLYCQAEVQAQKVYQAADQLRVETLKVLKIAFLSSAVLEFFTALSIALVAVYLGMSYLGYLDISLSDQPLLLFTGLYVLLLVPEFFQPLRELGGAHHAKANAEGAASLLLEVLSALPVAAEKRTDDSPLKRGGLRVEHLSVFSPDGAALLQEINLALAPGETVVVIGPSGGGKTTLLEAVMGFHQHQGQISDLDGQDLTAGSVSWQGQELTLLAATIRENLTLGINLSEEALWAVLRRVGLVSLVEELPQRLDTRVGEGGQALSAGQRQRILLARALLGSGELLLLDEPTAALDVAGAKALVTELRPLLAERCCLIVSHRPEFLALADRVVQMELGRLTPVDLNALGRDQFEGGLYE